MKVLIRNALGEKIINHYLPMSAVNAETFAATFLEGTYKGYEAISESGLDNAVTATDVSVMGINEASGKKVWLRFIAKPTKSESEIRSALTGLTIDGVLIDRVSFINFAPMTFA